MCKRWNKLPHIRKGIQWRNVNKSHSGRFRHIHTYSDIFRDNQAYSEPCVTLANSEPWYIYNSGIQNQRHIQNPGIIRTLLYQELWHIQNKVFSEPWYIQNQRHTQNQRHIQNCGIFRTLAYSQPWHIQNLGIFRSLVYSETDVYSEQYYIKNPRHIQNPFQHLRWNIFQKESRAIIIFANYSHQNNISFSSSREIKVDSFNTSLMLTPGVVLKRISI